MYIQSPTPEGQGGFTLPKGYSGNAFAPARQEPPQAPPAFTEPTAEPPPEAVGHELASAAKEEQAEVSPASAEQKQAAEAFAPACDKRGEGSLFTKIPFLSSLLPPARHKNAKGGLPEWAVVALVLFLLLNDNEHDNDLLPFVLLLLLWD